MRVLPQVVLLLKVLALTSLGISSAWAHQPAQGEMLLAATGDQTWKDTGKTSGTKESNSGSWKPQTSTTSSDDAENPDNEGEDSQTYDDGNS
ncbi:hypothetical protein P0D91_24990 [Pseudomonas sp. CBSPBW29]|uniref:hypothetical protein n=1 Tax=Pseudomonas TaxID=286 RepID=UPI0021AB9F4B|nr:MULTISPECIES: hypothetical protein [unclassified Pseudomonas]WEL41398.1 hypothetical protein P0D91_24990 [Pseudomonas sp. CBSPBW29]WEL62454.1 hypothetical protein P0D93_19160 [Pseudomonas sp. CBSPGW29]WEL71647.1 hypothetical protein P0D94_05100 [Pseudomonas sp. CBSPCGW29]WEL78557.1 hypothetical protein P0D92_11090 [Pseudomonas sp. CBSPAW29]WEL82806.1 hypothetical protein P0D95_01320 [Pseudomonas sp. CBSPCAW29]WEL85692.1 hypothetical protein P0D90_16995 [Pseudomonas sp. CBSPCBW29]